MQYRRLPFINIPVSEIALGTSQVAKKWKSQINLDKLLDEAISLGINFFDTADVYSEGFVETVLGNSLSRFSRTEFLVCTKGGACKGRQEAVLTPNHLRRSLEGSLRRLQLEYTDIYLVHGPDPHTAIEDTLMVLDQFVKEGKALCVGFSNFDVPLAQFAVCLSRSKSLSRLSCCQIKYSVLDYKPEDGLLLLCDQEGIGFIAYGALGRGLLTPSMNSSHTQFKDEFLNKKGYDPRRAARVLEFAIHYKIPMNHLALAWALRRPTVKSVLIGTTEKSHLRHNLDFSQAKVFMEDLEKVLAEMDQPTR